MAVLLSIKPKYVEQILKGNKKYEFRKAGFNKKKGAKAFIYATSPIKRIVAVFTVNEIFEDSPENLWEQFHEESGIEYENYIKYFSNKEKGYAIKIDDLNEFEHPIDPKEKDPSFRPPQSFYYIDSSRFSIKELI
ncbi:MAG: ASCH domain-containing protein [Candidatus Lokiarchaeota archaeon]|nr:ASCH domain-containing protein [Candidatus Lokiarchaeota archaeon]